MHAGQVKRIGLLVSIETCLDEKRVYLWSYYLLSHKHANFVPVLSLLRSKPILLFALKLPRKSPSLYIYVLMGLFAPNMCHYSPNSPSFSRIRR